MVLNIKLGVTKLFDNTEFSIQNMFYQFNENQ